MLFEHSYKDAKFPPPRAFQETAHEAIRAGFKAGHKNQLVMAPTGAGKSYIGHRIAQAALANGKRVLFVCDRSTLIKQTSEAADTYGLHEHGILQAQNPRRDDTLPYQIASIQTIAKREFWPKADVIIIDEAHTTYSAWTEYSMNTKAHVIGLSATPFTKGLGKIFSNLINAATMDQLTKNGVLVPMRILSCTRADMAGAKMAGGEWTDRAAEERGKEIIGDVVTEWTKYAENRKTIVFGATISHCEELAEAFIRSGVMAAVFTSNTTAIEREILLKEYKKPDSMLKVLISVEALAKGFDVPDVSCVVDCRPLRKSLSTAIQMWGRGLRSAPNKTDCILLDHSGNIVRFMADYEDIFFNGLDALDDGEKLDKEPRQEFEKKEGNGCPACGHKPFVKRCVSCGHEHKALATVSSIAGEMKEITLNGKKLAEDKAHLWAQIASYAKEHSKLESQQGRAYHLYKDMTGQNPPSHFRVDTAPFMPLTLNVANKIKSLHIAFIKSKYKKAA